VVYMKKLVVFSLSLMAFVSGVVGASGSDPCTPAEYQAILDGMISTGGQYLEVFPVDVPQFPAAFMEAQQRLNSISNAPFRGIYVVSHNLNDDKSILPDTIYSTPYIDGVVLRGLWSQIEPSPGAYDWSVVDLEITRAVANKKKIAVNVTTGAYAPAWLFAAPYNVPHKTFLWGNHQGANGACAPTVLPAPWDQQYEQAFASMMTAYAQHLKSIPGAYEATTLVGLTGINTLTDEMHLAFCSNSNGLALWQTLGYTPDKILAAGETLMSATNQAFPDKILALAIIESGGLPLINDAGQVVTSRKDPTYVSVKQKLIDYALSPASGISNRFAVQWNGFQTPADAAASVIAAGKNGAIVGWNTNEFGGRKYGAECN
jgi:Beta-galactosidase